MPAIRMLQGSWDIPALRQPSEPGWQQPGLPDCWLVRMSWSHGYHRVFSSSYLCIPGSADAPVGLSTRMIMVKV